MVNRHTIRKCQHSDSDTIYSIINEAARIYQGAIPADCYHQPYMSRDELDKEMKRVTFYGWEISNGLLAVMGIEPVQDITLIRHAYVLPQWQRQGIGSNLLNYLKEMVTTPRLLVGTWADAYWAIDFYQNPNAR